MFEVSVKAHFSAAHRLPGYEGNCSRVHGHNWDVQVFVRGERPDASGLLVDFRKLKEALRQVLQAVDHADLNGLPAFAAQNPTSEHLARHLFGGLRKAIDCDRYRVTRVRVSETPEVSAEYWEERTE